MKKVVLLFSLALFVSNLSYSQGGSAMLGEYVNGKLIKTVSAYTTSTNDTTGYVKLPLNLLTCGYCAIVAVATDSIQTQFQFLGSNSQLSSMATVVYADSITTLGGGTTTDWSATSPKSKTVVLKGPNKDNLPGCDQFKIGQTLLNSGTSGTSAARTLKLYLIMAR
jgi:hypothetical protein